MIGAGSKGKKNMMEIWLLKHKHKILALIYQIALNSLTIIKFDIAVTLWICRTETIRFIKLEKVEEITQKLTIVLLLHYCRSSSSLVWLLILEANHKAKGGERWENKQRNPAKKPCTTDLCPNKQWQLSLIIHSYSFHHSSFRRMSADDMGSLNVRQILSWPSMNLESFREKQQWTYKA